MPRSPRTLVDAPPEKLRRLQVLRAELAARQRVVAVAWSEIGRADQQPPDGPWLVWAYVAGRGAGKTRSAAEWVTERARASRCRGALVGRTPADVRDVMIEGESGLVAVGERVGFRPVYEPTKRRVTWPNGSTGIAYSAETPSALRGPQQHWAWADEPASWTDAPKGDVVDTAWNNLMLGLRLGPDPRCVFTTTPKPNRLVRDVLGRASTALTRGSTYDNLDNLAPTFRAQVLATYEGTRIGRQELMGELLDDVEGALWTVGMIEADRVDAAPDLERVVVAVDPSGSTSGDEQGVIVAGVAAGHVYVLADRSCRLSPHGWATVTVAAYREHGADRVVAERNYGGDMVAATLRQVDPNVPVRMVTASRGKRQRAEPVAALYEQHKVHHVGALPRLEDQMTGWTPDSGTSPDRVDALVWACTDLMLGGQGSAYLAHMRAVVGDAPTSARDWRQRIPRRDREQVVTGA